MNNPYRIAPILSSEDNEAQSSWLKHILCPLGIHSIMYRLKWESVKRIAFHTKYELWISQCEWCLGKMKLHRIDLDAPVRISE